MKTRLIFTTLALAATAAASATTHDTLRDTTRVIDIEEVVVIATPKENTRLRQQALSATSLSQADIRSRQIASVKSLSGLVPNLFIPDYGSKLTTSVYVRGIGSRINTPAVGLYVDNVPFIDKSAFDFNYSDIERIDVMRGPQGTLYGRNTMGGLIRVFTKSPFTYQGTDVQLSAATYNDYKVMLKHYHRISEQFAFSVGTFYEHKGGFFKNAFDGKRIDTDDEAGGRIRAIWLPNANLKLDFTANYEYTNQGGYPYAYTGRTDGEEEDRAEYIGTISYNRPSGYRRNLANGGLSIEHHARNFILSSVTGFQYLHDRMTLDQDFTEADIYTLVQKQDAKTLSQEIVLKSNPGTRWQWTTGVSGFYQWLDTGAPVTFHDEGISSLIEDNINAGLAQLPAGAPTLSASVTTRPLLVPGHFKTPVLNGAIYHQSTLNDLFTEGLSLTVGLRLDYEKLWLDYDSRCDMGFDFGVSAPFLPQPISRSLAASVRFAGKEHTDYLQLLPKFTLQYAWNPENNVYATVSRGYRSGGYNIQMFSDLIQADLRTAMIDAVKQDEVFGNFAGMIPDFPSSDVDVTDATLYKPEYAWNYEAGAHLTAAGGKLQTDLAFFYMDTRDQQISRFAETGLGRITVNAGKSRSIGAEASLRARLTDNFLLNGSYGYTYATFTDYVVSDTENYNGRYVPFVPKHTFHIGGQYRFVLRKNAILDNITVDANYRAAGRIYWTEQNNASQPFYGTLDGRLSFNKGNGQVALWITNALNKRYQAFYFESMNRGFEQQGRPLQVGIDLRCNF
ncbi:TonB-dependent receptor [Bacteroides gallinaceum]|uniref:TonB-dependent receptor n=1 Tax=Bacteroides TaxID=816 RepID=UPI000B3A18D4|nr:MULTISPECIES: TonB-dependent receptor [Bacteroides]MDN0079511.1 TonB-dependent receptor [Bacteroides gallinaceum]OUN81103.1 TonB-dependent receptor [Bacteroides sp. An51A]HJD10882.1 TonB-dependent receptor [Candidatus Phocaeicola caecigallinarum]